MAAKWPRSIVSADPQALLVPRNWSGHSCRAAVISDCVAGRRDARLRRGGHVGRNQHQGGAQQADRGGAANNGKDGSSWVLVSLPMVGRLASAPGGTRTR